MGGITLIYALLSLVLVQSTLSPDSFETATVSSSFDSALNDFGNLMSGFSADDSLMQFALFIIAGLATIWAARRLFAKEEVSIKQAFYQSPAPLIPVIILITLLFLQSIPLLLGSAGLQLGFNNGNSSSSVEAIAWVIVFILAASASLYMASRTVMAIFIATLPAMTPLAAYKKAKELVEGRRFSIIRKMFFLPFAIFTILGLILVPIIMTISIAAGPIFLLLGPLAVIISILYLFMLYQEIIK